jgi:hypothetical protein
VRAKKWSDDTKVNKKASELANKVFNSAYVDEQKPDGSWIVKKSDVPMQSRGGEWKPLEIGGKDFVNLEYTPHWDGFEMNDNAMPKALRAIGFDAVFVSDEGGMSIAALTDKALTRGIRLKESHLVEHTPGGQEHDQKKHGRRRGIVIGEYYTLRDGTEVQVTGHRVVRNEDVYTVRYPDNIMTGDSYHVDTEELRKASPSRKYGKKRKAKDLSELKPGDKFERDGHLWQANGIREMTPTLSSISAHRVNKRTGSTFGKEHYFPFKANPDRTTRAGPGSEPGESVTESHLVEHTPGGQEHDQKKHGRKGKGGKVATTLPKTNKEAASEVADAVAEWIAAEIERDPERFRYDKPPTREEVEKNWLKYFRARSKFVGDKGALNKLDGEQRQRVVSAMKENATNDLYSEVVRTNYTERVIFQRAEKGRWSAAEFSGQTTRVFESPWMNKDIGSTSESLVPGKATAGAAGGLAAILRHEYGHGLFSRQPRKWRSDWSSNVFASNYKSIGDDVTSYAAKNDSELFCELFALRTDKNWDAKKFKPWVIEATDKIMEAVK